MNSEYEPQWPEPSRVAGFRRTVLRGFGVILPPLLTIVVLIWAWTTIETYVLRPVEGLIRSGFGEEVYMPRWIVVPVFLIIFLTAVYFLGRLFTFGIGRWIVRGFDSTILRIPVINKVYGSVKQVTDFVFSEREIEFNRVVAVQYPREGIWSLGFVTGNSMREIAEATGEPMLSVLMPTSPMPMTGFTVTVKRSEAIDLNLTVDEAIQFVISCGVVVPMQQRTRPLGEPLKPAELPAASISTGKETSGPSAPAGA